MSTINVNSIAPESGTTITIGGSGDTVSLGSGASASGFTSGIVGVSTFTSSGTWTKSTREAALGVTIKRVIVEVQGAGGGGGTGDNYGSQGGFGGGYAKKIIDVSSISSSTITVGSGGAGGTGTGHGAAGGDSVWNDGTNTITGGGGSGGTGHNNTYNAPYTTQSTATGGDINIAGQVGYFAPNNVNRTPIGKGGDSYLGFGGVSLEDGNAPDYASGYGSGGSGGGTSSTTNVTGAAGRDGIVIVTEIAG